MRGRRRERHGRGRRRDAVRPWVGANSISSYAVRIRNRGCGRGRRGPLGRRAGQAAGRTDGRTETKERDVSLSKSTRDSGSPPAPRRQKSWLKGESDDQRGGFVRADTGGPSWLASRPGDETRTLPIWTLRRFSGEIVQMGRRMRGTE